MPPEDQSEVQARPSWVTEELLEKTVKVWSRLTGRKISIEEAIEMIRCVGNLMDKIRHAAQ